MKKSLFTSKYCLTVLLCALPTVVFAQGPNSSGTYYQAAEGKSGAALKTALSGIIYNRDEGGDLNTAYKALWTHFQTTDRRADGSVWVGGSAAIVAEGRLFV